MTETTAAAPGPQAERALTDGEQWAADALTALRADGFVPRAVSRFLRESLDVPPRPAPAADSVRVRRDSGRWAARGRPSGYGKRWPAGEWAPLLAAPS